MNDVCLIREVCDRPLTYDQCRCSFHCFSLTNYYIFAGISEIIIKPGLVNVDFADVRTIMGNAGACLLYFDDPLSFVVVICLSDNVEPFLAMCTTQSGFACPSLFPNSPFVRAALLYVAGTALMGIGHGKGKSRASDAAHSAISSPLLGFPIAQARGIVFNIVGGPDLTLQEINRYGSLCSDVVFVHASLFAFSLVGANRGSLEMELC